MDETLIIPGFMWQFQPFYSSSLLTHPVSDDLSLSFSQSWLYILSSSNERLDFQMFFFVCVCVCASFCYLLD